MSTAPDLTPLVGGAASKRGYTLFERAALAKQEMLDAKAKFDAIVDEIRESNDYGTTEEAGIKVTVAHNPVLDKALAFELFGEKVTERVVTAKAVKDALGLIDQKKCYKEGVKKVVVDRAS